MINVAASENNLVAVLHLVSVKEDRNWKLENAINFFYLVSHVLCSMQQCDGHASGISSYGYSL